MNYNTDYSTLLEMAEALVSERQRTVSALANLSALLYEAMDAVNWLGFYLVQDSCLYLAPFQGKVACREIKFGKGVCGACAKQGKTIIVDDVHSFNGHIACDSRSNSEIVVPIIKNGVIKGVLDIDSPELSRFSKTDASELEKITKLIANYCFNDENI